MQYQEEIEFNILRKVEDIKNQHTLAKELGFSVGKVNYILKALVQKGFVKAENFANSTNKKQYRYLLTSEGFQAKVNLTKRFIEHKKREYEELQSELREIEGGIK